MLTIFSSTDPSEIAFVRSLLSSEDIPFHVADVHMSVLDGSIGILPQRIMVQKSDLKRAVEVLEVNGLLK